MYFGENMFFLVKHVSGEDMVFVENMIFGEKMIFGESMAFGENMVSCEIMVFVFGLFLLFLIFYFSYLSYFSYFFYFSYFSYFSFWSGLRHACSCLENYGLQPNDKQTNNKQPPECRALQILVESGVWQLSDISVSKNQTIKIYQLTTNVLGP